MSYRTEPSSLSTRRIALVGLLVALALIAGLVESRFPLPFPGVRLGISNIFYLLAMMLFGVPAAFCVAAVRLALTFLVTGNVFALACSASGLACSLPLAAFLYSNYGRTLSVPAISVASSSAFNAGQLGAVAFMTGEPRIFLYFPVLMLIGFFTGYAVGSLADLMRQKLERFATADA